ncbi:PDZ domain-containing protein [Niallia sp. XMNu-256]|uniref:PDZ domain-containing protein n=1 Tax=Niallia sp. XMNu-256 TaxID=3082444 RepID=UPI0030CB0628
MAGLALEGVFALLRGLGKIFLNPVFYYIFILAIVLGISRVKRERSEFHVRAENAFYEFKQVIPLGLVIGLVLSIIMVIIGVVIPIEFIIFVALFTFILSFIGHTRWLTSVYTVGLAFFATLFLLSKDWELPLIRSQTPEWNASLLAPMAIVVCLLVIAEGILIFKNGKNGTSPKMIKSKRGLRVGIHEVKRIWMLPLLLFIPGESITPPFEWWPVFSIGSETYSFILVPFAIGFYQQIHSMLPESLVELFGKKVIKLGMILTVLSVVVYWYPLFSIIVVALAIIGREWLSLVHRLGEENRPLYFSRKQHGVMILGIIPHSPAERMGLKTGELIMKVNGIGVNSEATFYDALEKNRAHCKLEVLDVNDQIRYVQKALYEGDPFKLGIIFVLDDKMAKE